MSLQHKNIQQQKINKTQFDNRRLQQMYKLRTHKTFYKKNVQKKKSKAEVCNKITQ